MNLVWRLCSGQPRHFEEGSDYCEHGIPLLDECGECLEDSINDSVDVSELKEE